MDVTNTRPFVCSVAGCQKSFRRRDRLEIHARIHSGERPYKCHFEGCLSSYARSQHLSRHIDRAHADPCKKESLKVRCPECDEELADKFCLHNHRKRLHDSPADNKPYKCPEKLCGQSFHKKKQLIIHRLEHVDHLGVAAKCYCCPYDGCTKSFTFPNKLKRHLKVHQGYPCDENGCDQVLPNWSSLRKHKAVDHAPARTCSHCGISFKQKSNLKQHLQMHTEARNMFTCPRENCERMFLYNKNLMQHIRAFHDGEKIWKSRRKERELSSRKKGKHAKKKTMASRLCGVMENDGGKDVPETGDNNKSVIPALMVQHIQGEADFVDEQRVGVNSPNTGVPVIESSTEDQIQSVNESPTTMPVTIPENVDCSASSSLTKLKSRAVTILIENTNRTTEEVTVTVIS